MKKLFCALALFSLTGFVQAKEYGNHDLKRLLTVSETASGKVHGFDGMYLDKILNDMSLHARNYPVQFDSPSDQQRATQDCKALSNMLDMLTNVPNPNPVLLLRSGVANSMCHNLDIQGSAQRADTAFQKLLAIQPADPRANHLYGTFLAGSARPKEAIPHLQKAFDAGVVDAAHAMGMAHLALGNKQQALKNLEDYKLRKPNDVSVDQIIEAIKNGKLQIKKASMMNR